MAIQVQTGRGDMGDVTVRSSVARFSLPVPAYRVSGIKVTFSGGSGSASLAVRVDSRRGAQFNHTLFTLEGVGTGGDAVNFRVPEDDREAWTLSYCESTDIRDELVLEWTDPDGSTNWAIEVDLRNA